MKVALFGMFGVGNLGNEASLDAILRGLRTHAPDADPVAICPAPEAAARLHGIRAVPTTASFASRIARRVPLLRDVPAWLHALRTLRGVRLFVVPGTGILDDFGTGPRGLPLDLFRWCAAARLRGARVVFASVGAGPIHHPWSRRLMTWAVRLARYRSFRDPGSKAYMAGCGCDTARDAVMPDLVFGLPLPAATPRADGPLVVGVNAMAYYGWSHDPARGQEIHRVYIEKLAAFVRWLVGEGHVVRLFIGEDRDLAACRALHERIADDRVRPAEDASSLHELLAQFAATDLVVATRFHNVVAALMLAKPVVSIGYAVKNDELMADMGLGAYCQAIEQLDVERLKEQFLRLRAEREEISSAIAARTREYRTALDAQHAALLGNG